MNRIRSKQSFRFNQHPILLQTAFANFAQLNQFCDVTIVCENGEKMQAHRTMLAACSMYFEKCLLNVSMDRETYIILKDCHYNDMQLIIEFIYNGSVHVEEVSKRNDCAMVFVIMVFYVSIGSVDVSSKNC